MLVPPDLSLFLPVHDSDFGFYLIYLFSTILTHAHTGSFLDYNLDSVSLSFPKKTYLLLSVVSAVLCQS